MQKLHIEGQWPTLSEDVTEIQIPLPQLPSTGAWFVSGTVLAFNAGASGAPAATDSVAFRLAIAGNSIGGTAVRNDQGGATPYTTLPATGGLDVTIGVTIVGQTLCLTLNDSANNPLNVVWGWALDVESLSVP